MIKMKDCLRWHRVDLWTNISRNIPHADLHPIFWAQPRHMHTDHKLLTNTEPNSKVRRVFGKDTPLRTLFRYLTSSRLWSKSSPNVKLWRLLGRFTPSRLWLKSWPNVKLWRLLGRFTPSRLWLKHQPNVKLWRLLGRFTPSRLWLKSCAECQALKIAWQVHSFQALVEDQGRMSSSEDCLAGSLLPGSGWNDLPNVKLWRLLGRFTPCQALVEVMAECQALKIAWQLELLPGSGWSHGPMSSSEGCLAGSAPSKLLLKCLPECQALKIAWQVHSFQALVEVIRPNVKLWRLLGRFTPSRLWSKLIRRMSSSEDCLAGSLLPGSGWNYSRMSSSEDCLAGSLLPGSGRTPLPNVKLWRLLGRFTPSRLWLKLSPNVKLWRLLGRFTPSRLWSK